MWLWGTGTTGPLNDHTEGWHCSLKCWGHTLPLWMAHAFNNDPPFPTWILHLVTVNLFQLRGLLLEETGDSNCSIRVQILVLGACITRTDRMMQRCVKRKSEVTVWMYICLAGDIIFCICSYSYNPKTTQNWEVLLLHWGQSGEFLEKIN